MRVRLWLGVVAALLLPLAASIAGAEEVVETWRSPVGPYPHDVSVSPLPNSCWVAYLGLAGAPGSVAQLAPDGTPLLQTDAYSGPLAVNPADGSIWLQEPDAEHSWNWLIHLAADGAELLRVDPPVWPFGMVVDPTDGSCWIIEGWGDVVGEHGWLWFGGLGHIAEDGAALLTVTDDTPRWAVSVNPADGSIWVVQGVNGEVVHLTRDGAELYRGPTSAGSVAVDPGDGSCWVGGTGFVSHLAADGSELWRDDSYGNGDVWVPEEPPPLACAVAANTQDHTCWITDRTDVVHLAPDGTELSRTPGFDFTTIRQWFAAPGLSASPVDGSCWVADVGHGQVARLAVVGYPVQHFRDVPRDFWAFDEIEACAAAGIVQGYWDSTYRPDLEVTRDQMAVYIARALAGGDAAVPTGPAAPTFPDVSPDYWAFRYIEYCAANDVVQGYPGGNYRPAEVVNRGQMAVYIARAIASPTGDAGLADYTPPAEPTFSDVTADNDWAWCYRYVEYCADNDIVQGYWDGTYHPERAVTRDQMAVYIARAFVP
jgi:hypothetical protein